MNEIYHIKNIINKKWAKGFKQLGNNPIPLTKKGYIMDVLPNILNYYITDKADGLRCFLMITKNYIKYLTSEKVTYLQVKNPFTNEYIFDCELINDIIYIFDVIKYNNENVSNQTFQHRYKLLQEFQNKLNMDFIRVKKFYKLSVGNYQNTILNVYKYAPKSYTVDGLIFIESNANYNNTLNLKWKPPGFLTIDFLAIRTFSGAPNEYVLLTGINPKMAKHFGLETNANYSRILKSLEELGIEINPDYIPVPFYNSLIPNLFIFKTDIDVHGHIIELSLKDSKWVFHRIRYDRNPELKNGSYYGNNYKVAETTLQSILNPLSIKEMVLSYEDLIGEMYFKKQDDTYIIVKKFNNNIKNTLIQRYTDGEAVMDLASGRGGDLYKYAHSVKNLLMLEKDINAVDEIIDRKYKIFTNNVNCNLVVLQMDLNKDYKKNIISIENNFANANHYNNIYLYKKESIPTIFCHFAFHYLVSSEKAAKNIISFIAHYLSKNGKFVITIFDGQRVFDLLKQHNGMWKTDKYMIKSKNIGKIFSGYNNKIDVLLPLSDKPYEEPLIDLFALDKIFKKHNIMRVEERNFESGESMLNEDKQFISLYKYVIYTKIK